MILSGFICARWRNLQQVEQAFAAISLEAIFNFLALCYHVRGGAFFKYRFRSVLQMGCHNNKNRITKLEGALRRDVPCSAACVCVCVCVCVCLLWEYESGLTSQLFFDCEHVVLLAQQEVALSLLVSNLCQQFVLLCSVCRFGNEVLNLQDR